MAERLVVGEGVVVPAAALSFRAVRSGGPGGQNVNKVASKVELRVDLDRIEGLPADARARLDALVSGRLDADGRLILTSQRTRDQSRNLQDARERLRALVLRALRRPKARRPTRATAAGREARLAGKKRLSSRKAARGKVQSDD
jgi:ribosome-associated protein